MVDIAFDRGNALDSLDDKVNAIDYNANRIRNNARELKHAFVCRRIKYFVVIGVILFLVWGLYVLMVDYCSDIGDFVLSDLF